MVWPRQLVVVVVAFAATASAVRVPAGFFRQNAAESSWLPKETGPAAAFLPDLVRGPAHAPQPTSPPAPPFGEMELVRRFSGYTMSSDTCGFVSSYWDNAFTCARLGATCTQDSLGYMGCCTGSGSDCLDLIKTTCIPYSLSSLGSCLTTSGTLKTLCCSETEYPECSTYVLSTNTGIVRTLFDCDTATGLGVLLDYPPSLTRSTSSRSSSRSSSDKLSSSSAPPVVTVTSSSTPSSESSSGPPVAPIAGGVVGGVAVLALIGAGAFFLVRKARRRDEPSTPQTLGPEKLGAGAYPPPPASSVSPGPSSFDPRYSYPAGAAAMSTYPQQGFQPDQQQIQQPGFNNTVYSPHNSMYMGQPPATTASPPPAQMAGGYYSGTSPTEGMQQLAAVDNTTAAYGYSQPSPDNAGVQQQPLGYGAPTHQHPQQGYNYPQYQ